MIAAAVASCDVLVVLIGRRWLTAADPDGVRRLADPGDSVRLEIEAAMARDIVGGQWRPRFRQSCLGRH